MTVNQGPSHAFALSVLAVVLVLAAGFGLAFVNHVIRH